ncbi:MAG: ATP phosphoribosyltransferase, partial [Anaerolineae bacterium]
MARGVGETVRLALPSKGQLEEPALAFLERCGMRVSKTNPRQYLARMPAFPQVEVLFQRPADIFAKVRDGDVGLGITGFDVVAEGRSDGDEVLVLYENLGYGGCDLVLAVPEGWLDINCLADLADLALEWWEQGRPLRIATKYPNLVREFLYRKDVHHFTLVEASGAIEAAPAIGYADLIADITATGTTLRENRLKQLDDGTILHSEACFIGNRSTLAQGGPALSVAERMLELIEAHQRGRRYRSVLANIPCNDPAALARQMLRRPAIAGLRGPSFLPIYDANGDCMAVTVSIVVQEEHLHQAIQEFREIGSTDVIVSPVEYIFGAASEAVRR